MALSNRGTTSERMRLALPAWKVLLILLTFLIVCSAGYLWWSGKAEPQTATSTTTVRTPAPTTTPSVQIPGFTSSTPAAEPAPQTVTTTTIVGPSWKQTAGQWGLKLGLSFLAALVIGVMARVFIKVAVGFAAIVFVCAVLAGWSGIFSAEKTDAAKQRIGQAVEKIEDSSAKLKDLAFASLPAAGASLVGFFVGFARR